MHSCIIHPPSFTVLFNTDYAFLPVNLDYFASLLTLVVSLHNPYFIILSDGYWLSTSVLSQLFERQGKSIEIAFVVLALVGIHKEIELHLAAGTLVMAANNFLFKCFFVILSNRFYLYDMPSDTEQMSVFFLFGGTNKHV